MKILAIETSVKESSIAIMDNNDCYELFTDTMNDTAKSLPILVENALSKTKNSFQDLDAIAISMGPGSFTGLRVGLSYAKGLSLALDIPIVPISTFESMINIVKPNSYSIINTVIYSHSTFVYNAEYELKDNLYLPVTEPTLVDISASNLSGGISTLIPDIFSGTIIWLLFLPLFTIKFILSRYISNMFI